MEKIQTTLNPYLTFAGNCREVMNFYQRVFGGKLELMTFENSPMEVPDDYMDKIMHSVLKFGDATIMASDGMPGQTFNYGSGFSIIVALPTVEEAESTFNKLAEGGKIIMPFDMTFWNSMFGYCTDSFGINWMVSCEI